MILNYAFWSEALNVKYNTLDVSQKSQKDGNVISRPSFGFLIQMAWK